MLPDSMKTLIHLTNSMYLFDVNSNIFSTRMYWVSNLKKHGRVNESFIF